MFEHQRRVQGLAARRRVPEARVLMLLMCAAASLLLLRCARELKLELELEDQRQGGLPGRLVKRNPPNVNKKTLHLGERRGAGRVVDVLGLQHVKGRMDAKHSFRV